MKKYLITGVTGVLGKEVLNLLLKKVPAAEVAVLVRKESSKADFAALGVEVRLGDYSDLASLEAAFTGIENLYFVSGSEIDNRSVQHENVVKTATKAHVGRVVYTSFQRRNETETSPIAMVSQSHLVAEKALQESGLNYTILQHGLYMDLLPWFIGEQIATTKTIYLPSGEGKAAFILRSDLAKLAVNVLTTSGHDQKVYAAFSDHAVSYKEIAAALTGIFGTEIGYVSPSIDEYVATLNKAGVPAEIVGMLTGFSVAIAAGEFSAENPEIGHLIGEQPVDVKTFLAQVYAS